MTTGVGRGDGGPAASPHPRSILAPNASPMTMAGTVTYLVGHDEVAVIDPGSAAESHLAAVGEAVRGARSVTILLTHDHPDHSTGALDLARRLNADVRSLADRSLHDGAVVATDHGALVVLATPGHCPDHVAFHWPAASAIFCGDLMMGGLDTAVVAAPEGSVGAYLQSLERLRRLSPETIYPSHGPPFTDPSDAIERYVRHRAEREEQVLAAVRAGARTPSRIADHVYGDSLDPRLRGFALGAIEAYLQHLHETDRLPDGVSP
jgi:glyoxylase-like metal-dependent hydrolase (beta-lactamase superfamily II)